MTFWLSRHVLGIQNNQNKFTFSVIRNVRNALLFEKRQKIK